MKNFLYFYTQPTSTALKHEFRNLAGLKNTVSLQAVWDINEEGKGMSRGFYLKETREAYEKCGAQKANGRRQ